VLDSCNSKTVHADRLTTNKLLPQPLPEQEEEEEEEEEEDV
jgi:hypothetical protein